MTETYQIERNLAAIIVEDIVGFSWLVEVGEASTSRALKSISKIYRGSLIEDYRGKVV